MKLLIAVTENSILDEADSLDSYCIHVNDIFVYVLFYIFIIYYYYFFISDILFHIETQIMNYILDAYA